MFVYLNIRVLNVVVSNSALKEFDINKKKKIKSKIWTSIINDIVSDGNKVYQPRLGSSIDIYTLYHIKPNKTRVKDLVFIQILSQIKS